MKKWLRKNGVNLLLMITFLVGLGLLAYPTVADYWNRFHQSRAIATYAEEVAEISNEEYEQMLEEAIAYNKALDDGNTHWHFTEEELERYNRTLNISGTGIMGYIEIDKIHCSLPIYHGTADSILQIAIGHITGSSLPVGGTGSHCVLSGHRGLPSAKLFTDLDKLGIGDTFVIRTLDEMYTYEIQKDSDILIVEPTDIESLRIVPGEDLVTLVTCTPYGINTHRLLVTGHRVENAETVKRVRVIADAMKIEPVLVAPFVGVPVLVLLIIFVYLFTGRKKRRKS